MYKTGGVKNGLPQAARGSGKGTTVTCLVSISKIGSCEIALLMQGKKKVQQCWIKMINIKLMRILPEPLSLCSLCFLYHSKIVQAVL